MLKIGSKTRIIFSNIVLQYLEKCYRFFKNSKIYAFVAFWSTQRSLNFWRRKKSVQKYDFANFWRFKVILMAGKIISKYKATQIYKENWKINKSTELYGLDFFRKQIRGSLKNLHSWSCTVHKLRKIESRRWIFENLAKLRCSKLFIMY